MSKSQPLFCFQNNCRLFLRRTMTGMKSFPWFVSFLWPFSSTSWQDRHHHFLPLDTLEFLEWILVCVSFLTHWLCISRDNNIIKRMKNNPTQESRCCLAMHSSAVIEFPGNKRMLSRTRTSRMKNESLTNRSWRRGGEESKDEETQMQSKLKEDEWRGRCYPDRVSTEREGLFLFLTWKI